MSADIGAPVAALTVYNDEMRVWALGAVATFSVVVLPSPSAFGQANADFRTPGEAAYCVYDTQRLHCWTPNDGFTVSMTTRGRPHKAYHRANRGYVDNSARLLRFGHRIRISSFVCTSRSTGLGCVNQRGHGWHLGRYVGYRLF